MRLQRFRPLTAPVPSPTLADSLAAGLAAGVLSRRPGLGAPSISLSRFANEAEPQTIRHLTGQVTSSEPNCVFASSRLCVKISNLFLEPVDHTMVATLEAPLAKSLADLVP